VKLGEDRRSVIAKDKRVLSESIREYK